ncbi:MAG: IMS domain-containing protein [Oscillatoria sp. PMC 1068.18]|nr:IMS domain-containing protein [Oscillatoria sp. PMC 1076.18]MEC4988496.1 IMS domain-containing protein [Oscillatoria sp. PMC 1068.18]
MRIPLDYYRIIGVPIQASDEQIAQAYQDRTRQLPRREYSDAAIAARKELLESAFSVLSDSERRSTYDAKFFAKNPESGQGVARGVTETQPQVALPLVKADGEEVEIDPRTPWIEINSEQFVGALLMLQELGEYELVLKLGHRYLDERNAAISVDKGLLGEPQLVRADIVLTLALACLELGREQWQQGHYENAAVSGQTGQELLLHEGLFPSVRGEIQADLYKLRPYRILELLALGVKKIRARRKGLQLLREMLAERGGIDGTGEDQSGLSIDDFLRFIQQLRSYLTAAEQQELFEAEARRPSAVATYLAVYSLLGRGFAERDPGLILRAKEMLMRLGKRQDVHLEQAVCALLLGQTEEATRALELSQEYEPLAFIREHSQGAPDLLPGLCLYGERWLQTEVFPHFRDLANNQVSLKDYFADQQVQGFLEELPGDTGNENQWSVEEQTSVGVVSPSGARNGQSSQSSVSIEGGRGREGRSRLGAPTVGISGTGATTTGASSTLTALSNSEGGAVPTTPRGYGAGVSTLAGGAGSAERSSQLVAGTDEVVGASGDRVRGRRSIPAGDRSGSLPMNSALTPGLIESTSNGNGSASVERRSAAKSSSQLARLLLVGAGILLGLLLLIWGSFKLVQSLFSQDTPTLEEPQPVVTLSEPPVEIPESEPELVAPSGALTEATGEQAIRTWFAAKAAALGPEHQVDRLNEILAEPLLSKWRKTAQALQRSDAYRFYGHELTIESVTENPQNPDQGTVEAVVREVAKSYRQGELNSGDSYDENLRVRYNLVRENGQWQIKGTELLKSKN